MDKHVLHNILHRDAGNNSKDCPVCNGSIGMNDKSALMAKANEILARKQQMGMTYNEDEQDLIDFAELNSKARNNLNDSSFAYIDSKGEKHLPIPDASHVRNALARFDQTHFDSEEDKKKAKVKILAKAKELGVDAAENDEKKNGEPSLVTSVDLFSFAEKEKLPTRIKILPYGTIKSPVYGDVILNKQVMEEMIKHFNDNLRASSSKIGLPIDVEHGTTDLKDAAAGWIKKLFAEKDGGYADVDWTPLGQQKLEDKEYKLISPSFYLKGFKHPETGKEYENVLTGAALVNKPGMPASLPPIVNSEQNENTLLTQQKNSPILFVEVKNTSTPKMNLQEIVAKEKTARTSEEQAFLIEHKEELSFADAKKEGVAMDFKEAKKEEVKPEVKPGEVVMSEQDVKTMKEDIEAGKKAFAELQVIKKEKALMDMKAKVKELAFVEGEGVRLPADQVEKWATKLVTMSETDRTEALDMLKALPVKAIFKEEGSENAINVSDNPTGALDQLVKAKIAEAAKTGKEMKYSEAQEIVTKEKPDLVKAAYGVAQ